MLPLYFVIACGALSIVYAVWAIQSVLAADAGNARMQEISGARGNGVAQVVRKRSASHGARAQ